MKRERILTDFRPDLHIHSTFSDGLYTPQALCRMAASAGITHLSLCDHDTLAGLEPMQSALKAQQSSPEEEAPTPEICFLPGVEVSTGKHGQTHILGYGANPNHPVLRPWMDTALDHRRKRLAQMLAKLSALGITIPQSELPAGISQAAGRAHIARALVKLGKVNNLNQAFDRFLGEGKPAYVPYEHISATDAISLLRQAHCVPVLAHPARISVGAPVRSALIRSLMDAGLMGIEVFHPSASRRDIRALETFARKHGLLVTGGSDFHGDARAAMGSFPSGWTTMKEDVSSLWEAVSRQASSD